MMTQGPAFFAASDACAPETSAPCAPVPAPRPSSDAGPAPQISAAIQTERPPRWSRGQGGGSFGNYQQRRQFFFDAVARAATARQLAVAADLAASEASVAGTAVARQPSAAARQPPSWQDWEFYEGEFWRRTSRAS